MQSFASHPGVAAAECAQFASYLMLRAMMRNTNTAQHATPASTGSGRGAVEVDTENNFAGCNIRQFIDRVLVDYQRLWITGEPDVDNPRRTPTPLFKKARRNWQRLQLRSSRGGGTRLLDYDALCVDVFELLYVSSGVSEFGFPFTDEFGVERGPRAMTLRDEYAPRAPIGSQHATFAEVLAERP